MELPEGRLADLHDSCKYLGIPQATENQDKDSATAKYLQKVIQVLRNQLNVRNKIEVINS